MCVVSLTCCFRKKYLMKNLLHLKVQYRIFICCAIALFALLSPALQAQTGLTRHQWLFGANSYHLIFDAGSNQATLDSLQVPMGPGGTAVATDAITGALLFYTDGINVYDAEHRLMPNGAGLGGSNQIHRGAAILPVTDSLDLFYVVVNSGGNAPNQLQSYLVDLSDAGNNTTAGQPAAGDVVTGSNQVLMNNPTEAMEIIYTNTPDLNYLLVQESGSNDLILFRNNGMAGLNPVDTFALPQPFEAASFAWYPLSQKIAVAPKEQFRNVQILDVDVLGGSLSFDQEILNTGNSDFATEAIYDTEWSPDGRYLYMSRHGGTTGNVGTIYQYDFLDSAAVPRSIFSTPLHRSYDLTLGPDGRIYHLYQEAVGGDFLMAALLNPNDSIDSLVYVPDQFAARDFAASNFPLFAPEAPQEPISVNIQAVDLCLGNDTKFLATLDPKPDTYSWDFGDGSGSNDPAPIHTYQSAGTFQVVLNVGRGNQSGTDTLLVTITDPMTQLDLGADTVICPDETLTLDATTAGAVAYAWNTGETTPTITVDTTNLYWVAVDLGGCVLYDAIRVDEYGVVENISNFWYFGENAGIDFNNGVTPLDDGAMNAPAGSATISDLNGALLFYTDGETVYNRNHAVMPNGDNLGGDNTATMSAAIVPFPGDSTYYYVFSTQEVYGDGTYDLTYSVIDIKGDNGFGTVVEKNICLYQNITERLIIAGGGVGQDAWVLVHEHGSANFVNFPVTAIGIGDPVFSTVGSVHSASSELTAKGYMKFNQAVDMVAVALASPTANQVEIFRFDFGTGMLSPYIGRLDVGPSFNANQQVYGVEFSAGSRKLFVSLIGLPSEVYEYWIDSADVDVAKSFEAQISPAGSAFEYGALQRGPDQQIYVAVNGQPQLGGILENEDSLTASTMNDSQVGLIGGTLSTLGLPNTDPGASAPPTQPAMAVGQACAGDTVDFVATVTSIIDEVQWTISTPAPDNTLLYTSNLQQDQFVFDSAGTYEFTLRITNRCGFDTTLVQTVEAFGSPNVNQFPAPLAICGPTLDISALPNDTPNVFYLWSTGDTTRVISVTNPGFYDVTVTNSFGCAATSGSIQVVDGNPAIDLGPDPQFVCEDDAITDLDAGNPGAAYVWYLDGAANGNTGRFQTVDTNVPGTYTYRVEVTDPVSGCTGQDSVTFTVNTNPVLSATASPTTGCGNADGSIDLTVSNAGNFSFNWSNGATTEDVSGLAAGNYTVTVTDAVSGCSTASASIAVNDGATDFTIDSATPDGPTCTTGTGTNVVVTLNTNAVFPVFYLIDDGAGNMQTGSATSTGNSFTVSGILPGTYALQVTGNSGTGCTQASTFTVAAAPNANVNLSSTVLDVCLAPADNGTTITVVNGSDALDYSWSTTNGSFTGATNTRIVGVDGTGDYTVLVTDPSLASCDTSLTVTVNLNRNPEIEIQATGDDCDGILEISAIDLNDNGTDNYSYLWNNGSNAQTIALTADATVSVDVNNSTTGCSASADSSFTVSAPVTVNLVNDQPLCDLGGSVTLTAQVTNPNVTFDWERDGIEIQDSNDSVLIVSQAGTYVVNVTTESCNAADALVLTLNTSTPSQLLSDYQICSLDPANASVSLDPGPFVLFNWVLPEGGTTTGAPLTAGVPGLYYGAFTNGGGCVTRDTLLVRDVCEPLVDAPTAFAPGRNNTTFRVFPNDYVTGFEINIYNRWGELVHTYTGPAEDFAWDGTYADGAPAPVGTYAYIMRYESEVDPSRGTIEQRGGVVLLR